MIMNTHINKTNIVRERERREIPITKIIIEKILYTDERTTMTTKNKQNYLENREEKREENEPRN